MTEPDILDFDTRVKKAGPLRQRGNILYFAPRDDYPTRLLTIGPHIKVKEESFQVHGAMTELPDHRYQTMTAHFDLDTAVMALYMTHLNHCNRDLEITE